MATCCGLQGVNPESSVSSLVDNPCGLWKEKVGLVTQIDDVSSSSMNEHIQYLYSCADNGHVDGVQSLPVTEDIYSAKMAGAL